MTRPSFLGNTAIVGVGETAYMKESGRSVLSLALEACSKALQDSGLDAGDVDGVVSFSYQNDSVGTQAIATGLHTGELRYSLDLNLGGQAPSFAVINAAMAIHCGMAKNVLVYRALNGRSGERVGSRRFPAPTNQYRYPIGLTAYPQFIAMWAQRYLSEVGAKAEDLSAVPIAQRRYAQLNERAIIRKPLDLDTYMQSDVIVDPFRLHDCTAEVDGACAVLVTSVERARDLNHRPAVIEGAAWATGGGAGYDIGDNHLWADYTRNCQSHLRDALWSSARMSPKDVDFAEIYDCFSSSVVFGLEGLGLVGRGEALDFIRDGQTWLDGALPVNTNGGMLSEGYLHGMNTLAEAVKQLQGRGGDRQVTDARICAVTSGALVDGSALVLVAS
ncbi:MAG: lipid-transfer protein [Burkholderiales bacterium]